MDAEGDTYHSISNTEANDTAAKDCEEIHRGKEVSDSMLSDDQMSEQKYILSDTRWRSCDEIVSDDTVGHFCDYVYRYGSACTDDGHVDASPLTPPGTPASDKKRKREEPNEETFRNIQTLCEGQESQRRQPRNKIVIVKEFIDMLTCSEMTSSHYVRK